VESILILVRSKPKTMWLSRSHNLPVLFHIDVISPCLVISSQRYSQIPIKNDRFFLYLMLFIFRILLIQNYFVISNGTIFHRPN